MTDEPKGPLASSSDPQSLLAAQKSAALPYSLDSDDIATLYTNFCHVTFTPEELILDFGLNTQTQPTAGQRIKLTHRVVMNFYTAKRLMQGLHYAVSHYESLFGSLEVDFQKRMRPTPAPRPTPGAGGTPGKPLQ